MSKIHARDQVYLLDATTGEVLSGDQQMAIAFAKDLSRPGTRSSGRVGYPGAARSGHPPGSHVGGALRRCR